MMRNDGEERTCRPRDTNTVTVGTHIMSVCAVCIGGSGAREVLKDQKL